MLTPAFNFQQWIDEHRHLLKPPVPRVPHSPQRGPDSIGLVIERKRLVGELDGLLWYCELCNLKLYEEYFQLVDIEKDFPAVFERFYRWREARTCKGCGHLNPAPARYADAAP